VRDCSIVARGYEPWDSAERESAYRLRNGMVIIWRWWYIDPRIETWLWTEMGWNVCGNGVKTWLTIIIHLIRKCIGNPSLIGSFWLYPCCIQYHKAMLIRVGVASTNRTDKLWHTGSAEEYSSEEFDGWGVRSYARVWRSYLQAVLDESYLWSRQCGNVIIYVIPHLMYSDIIVVWMWYSTGI
jgi:hypothetical protein